MLYGEKLKFIREKNEMIQQDMANIIGIERGLYSQYETEYFVMPIKHIGVICDALNLSLDYLFCFSMNEKYPTMNPIDIQKMSIRLKELRKENKLTQNKLSSILNTSQSVIAGYENEKNLIATPFLYTICKNYHVSADYLLGRVDSPKYLK